MTQLFAIEVVRAITQDREREILRGTQLAAARRAASPRLRVGRPRRYSRGRVRPAV